MLSLKRTYLKHYTAGVLTLPDDSALVVLELPWLDNQLSVSCIPEGRYIVDRNTAGKHQWYALRNEETDPRTFIEIHPANRISQLEGCLAPCLEIKGGASTADPIAFDSVKACEKLLEWFGDDSFVLEISS